MNRCPISYSMAGESLYSLQGLRSLAYGLSKLHLFEYTADEQRIEAFNQASKMSIQGVQPKLSAILNIKHEKFEIVVRGGRYILKLQHPFFPQMPENEDLTMRLAETIG
jgi:serine/threonine-protein kinase HipA